MMSFAGWRTGTRALGDLSCRIAFGWGALLTDVLVLLLLLSTARKTLGESAGLARLQRALEWTMLVVLAPLLLVLAVFALVGGGSRALSGWFVRRFGQIKNAGGDSR